MGRLRGSTRARESDQQINLTPMLDVVFIMLIFFIVTATFVREVGIDTNPPDHDRPPRPVEARSILVRIGGDDRITIGQRHVDRRAVRANIERLHAQVPEAPVVIEMHSEASAEALVHVMDQSRQAGVYDVSLVDR